MKKNTRFAFNAYLQQLARLNGVAVEELSSKFTVEPSVQQTLEDQIQQSAAFLTLINVTPVTEQSGQLLGLGVGSTIAGTTDTTAKEREPVDPTLMVDASYARSLEVRDRIAGAGTTTTAAGLAMGTPVMAAVKSYTSMEDAMKGVAKQVNGLRDDNGNRTARFYEMQDAIKAASEQLPMENGAVDFAALVEGGARMNVANPDDSWEDQKRDLLAFASRCSAQSDRSCGYCTGGRGAGCLEILATHHRISRWRGGRIQSGGRSHQCCIRTA